MVPMASRKTVYSNFGGLLGHAPIKAFMCLTSSHTAAWNSLFM